MTLLDTILHHNAPHLESLTPTAAMPGGVVDVRGAALGAVEGELPVPTIGDIPAQIALSSSTRLSVRIPEGSISGDLIVRMHDHASNGLPLRVAVPLADNLHPIGNPAVDADGNLYATFSGPRGQQTPVSIFRIDRDFQMRPFVRDLLNASGLAFDRTGNLYASSRAEGTVYRISPSGAMTTYAEGMGIATGLAFDNDGNLFVGDRSGTIFKISPTQEIFVYATLEPSMAAYHLAFLSDGTLLVSGPTTNSFDSIYAIDRNGDTSTYYRGLGRPQGLAVDVHGNVYVAASLRGQRGIIKITPQREATLALSGSDLVGLAFTEDGCAALATTGALYHVDMQTEGRPLF
jgi:outer membrane protein assembly factor BamB